MDSYNKKGPYKEFVVKAIKIILLAAIGWMKGYKVVKVWFDRNHMTNGGGVVLMPQGELANPNGYDASIVVHNGSYGGPKNSFEILSDIIPYGGVEGWLGFYDVLLILEAIEEGREYD